MPATPVEKFSRREDVIEAAIRVVGRKGLAGASIRAIAHEVGLTIGVVTHHFGDKSELLCAALGSCFAPWRNLVDASRTIADPVARLRHVMAATMTGNGHPAAQMQLWLGMLSQIDLDPNVADAYRQQYRQTRADMVEILRACQDAGALREGVVLEEAAAFLLSLGDGLLVSSIGEPEFYREDFIKAMVMVQVDNLLRNPA